MKARTFLQVLDAPFARALTTVFENDLQQAARITSPQELAIPESAIGTLAERYFFDQL